MRSLRLALLALLPISVLSTGFLSAPEDELRGLWIKEGGSDAELRFYYFHSDNIGLYRYGRRNLNNTNSYDFRVEDGRIALTFRKTGEKHRVRYRLERDGDNRYLVLENDPRESGPTRYRKLEGPLAAVRHQAPDHPFARMWIDQKALAKGGVTFRMYQFQPPDASGRGKGWYHQGDYDDWSTEALTYQRTGGTLRLFFVERREREVTPMIETRVGDERAIDLMSDPRNFWHRGRFVDGGRSFMMVGWAPAFIE